MLLHKGERNETSEGNSCLDLQAYYSSNKSPAGRQPLRKNIWPASRQSAI